MFLPRPCHICVSPALLCVENDITLPTHRARTSSGHANANTIFPPDNDPLGRPLSMCGVEAYGTI